MQPIKDGEYTKTIYTMIKDERYADAIKLLNSTPEAGTTRAGLSLLGYCFYMEQEFVEAADCYERLLEVTPEKAEYKFYYAQSLFQAGLYEEAYRVSQQLEGEEFADKVCRLQGAVRYAQEDYTGAQAALGGRVPDDPDTLNDEGCLLYQAEHYEDALGRFVEAIQCGGYKPTVAYNAALCHYQMRDNTQALNFISEIVERGIRAHPELAIGTQTESDGAARCIGNPPSLQSSGLAQALNLRAAIEYREGNMEGALQAMMDLPPRSEPELDPVTLHNLAVTRGGPEGLRRLSYLLALGAPACPQPALANLLIVCCKHELFDAAADALADHADLTYRYLTPFLYELVDALICSQTAPAEAAMKLEALASGLTARLRSLTARVEDARQRGDQTLMRTIVRDYEETLGRYLPVAAAQAWLPWRRRDWSAAELEFRASGEFCSEAPEWQLLAAHVLFMAGDRYKEAAKLYEPLVRQRLDSDVLAVSAGVLANLCVAYIMTSQNEAAEDLMRRIEREEERRGTDADGRPQLHLCIVNLVIGTLYCSKGNYEFGLSRIARALEGNSSTSASAAGGRSNSAAAGDAPGGPAPPASSGAVERGGGGGGERLCADTWLHAKRCVLGLCAGMAKQTLVLPSSAIRETMMFLENCETYGKRISSVLTGGASSPDWAGNEEELSPAEIARKTVAYEARMLRCLLVKIQNN